MKTYKISDQIYDVQGVLDLREAMILIRNQFLDDGDMLRSVQMTHCVALLNEVAKDMK